MATVTPSSKPPFPTSATADTAILVEPDANSSASSHRLLPPASFSFAESAALVLLFSLLIFIEGGIRLNEVDVKQLEIPLGEEEFSRVVLFIAAIAELVFGLFGILLGLYSLASCSFNKRLFRFTVPVQVILSLFVFIVYNIAVPSYRINKVKPFFPRQVPNISLFRAAEAMALLTGVHFTLALFGGQLLFMTRMAASAPGRDASRTVPRDKTNALGWNVNLALAGLWSLILGSGVLSHPENFPKRPGVTGTIFFFPPHGGTEPGFTIATGVVMILWGLLGVLLTFRRFVKISWFMHGSVFVAIVVYFNFTLVQFGQLRSGIILGGFVATNTIFVFVIFFLSSFFLYRAHARGNEKE